MGLWQERSALKSLEFCLGIDEGNTQCLEAAERAARQYPNTKIAINRGPKNCVSGWNTAAKLSSGKVLIAISDDFVPPINWDNLLLDVPPKGWIEGEYVVKVHDGYNPQIFVLPILTRKRYEKFGYIFYPKYESMYCDTEFGEVAIRDKVVLYAEYLLFEHYHCDVGKRVRDEHDLVHASPERYVRGESLYKLRKALNFPQDITPQSADDSCTVGIQASNSYVPPDKLAVFMVAIKDDFCIRPVLKRLVEEGLRHFFIAQPDCYWSGEPLEPEFKEDIPNTVNWLRQQGVSVRHRIFKLEDYGYPKLARNFLEAAVRNSGAEWGHGEGFEHLLIVDSDELWIPGTLETVCRYIRGGAGAISSLMIPVVGLPAYPVENAADTVLLYIHKAHKFIDCRSPNCSPVVIPQRLVYHFTATRASMQEIIKKHRRSGHYGDPSYDFENWFREVLPNIKPGLQNAHMYKPNQIWPKVRAWTPEELKMMPDEIRQYLGKD